MVARERRVLLHGALVLLAAAYLLPPVRHGRYQPRELRRGQSQHHVAAAGAVELTGALLAAMPTLLVYVVLGRYFVRGLLAGSLKGRDGALGCTRPTVDDMEGPVKPRSLAQ